MEDTLTDLYASFWKPARVVLRSEAEECSVYDCAPPSEIPYSVEKKLPLNLYHFHMTNKLLQMNFFLVSFPFQIK